MTRLKCLQCIFSCTVQLVQRGDFEATIFFNPGRTWSHRGPRGRHWRLISRIRFLSFPPKPSLCKLWLAVEKPCTCITRMIDWPELVVHHASTWGVDIAPCVHPVLRDCFQHALVAWKSCSKRPQFRVATSQRILEWQRMIYTADKF